MGDARANWPCSLQPVPPSLPRLGPEYVPFGDPEEIHGSWSESTGKGVFGPKRSSLLLLPRQRPAAAERGGFSFGQRLSKAVRAAGGANAQTPNLDINRKLTLAEITELRQGSRPATE